MRTKFIDLAEACDPWLGPRYPEEGDFSGEEFRTSTLLPALRDFDQVVVNLDNVDGFTWSFVDEAFGGAVWALGGLSVLVQKLTLVADFNAEWKERALAYMDEAEEARKTNQASRKRWRAWRKEPE